MKDKPRFVVLIEFGSTYTKVAVVDTKQKKLIKTDHFPSTVATDARIGLGKCFDVARDVIGQEEFDAALKLSSSSAAGGLRMGVISYVFGALIFAAIYTTACPLLWTASSRFTQEGTTNFKIVTVILAVAGLFVALYIPFNILLNYVYVINGYAGAVLFVWMVIRLIMMKSREKREALV